MNKKSTGFVVAKSRSVKEYFTSRSSYDYPKFTNLSESTIYNTPEAANHAASKLWGNGVYSAAVISLSEMDLESEQEVNPKDQMTDDVIAPDDIDDIDLSDTDSDGDGTLDVGDIDTEENESALTSPIEQKMMKGGRTNMPSGQGPRLGESVTKPSRPNSVAPSSENKNTAVDLPKTPIIKYKQSTGTNDDVNYSKDIEPLDSAHTTPADILSSLKSTSAEFRKAYEYNNGKDDGQSSMALTISSALDDILADLSHGTEEGYTAAQIRFSTYMNPITMHFPNDVKLYLYKKDRQPSLMNAFYDTWDNLKK